MGKKKNAGDAGAVAPGVSAPFNNPFGALGGLRVEPGTARDAPSEEPPSPPPQPGASPYVGKLVVSRERKGHGGKTATRLHGVELPAQGLAHLARELGAALGTAARADGTDIIVSGDQRERLAQWLGAHGATRVVVGN